MNVLSQILFVILKGGAALSLVITPRHQELSRELIVLVPYHFPDEGKLTLSYLISNRRDVEESCAVNKNKNTTLAVMSLGNFVVLILSAYDLPMT